MKFALDVKLYQHEFTIDTVIKLLVHGHGWDKFDEKYKNLQDLHFLKSADNFKHHKRNNITAKIRLIQGVSQ